MDLASLGAISVCLFAVVIAALDSHLAPCLGSVQEPREGFGSESEAFKAKAPLGLLDLAMVLCPGARAAIY